MENIYPSEVEDCFDTHTAVKESAVIGLPDPRWTQNLKLALDPDRLDHLLGGDGYPGTGQ